MFPEYIYLAGPIISILALFFLMKFNSPPGDIVLNLSWMHNEATAKAADPHEKVSPTPFS